MIDIFFTFLIVVFYGWLWYLITQRCDEGGFCEWFSIRKLGDMYYLLECKKCKRWECVDYKGPG